MLTYLIVCRHSLCSNPLKVLSSETMGSMEHLKSPWTLENSAHSLDSMYRSDLVPEPFSADVEVALYWRG